MLGRWREALMLSLCVISVAFLMEFDLGVPQYPAATEFIIAGFLFTWVACAVRSRFGPGGALFAAAVYLGVHAYLWATIAALPGVLTARFLLFVPAAVLVELVALVVSPRTRAVAFGLVSGALVGTVGLAAEWLWSKAFLPLPQPVAASALPLMLGAGTVAALGGGLLSAWHVARLDEVSDPARPLRSRARWTGLVGIGLGLVMMAALAPPSSGSGDVAGTVGLSRDCDGTSRCLATVTVQLEPADAADDAVWFYALAWQGRGPKADAVDPPVDPESGAPGIMRVALEPTGKPGEFRTAQALPLYGNWKTLLRLHLAPTTLRSLPLHAPDDPAISGVRGRQVLVHDGDTVQVVPEKQFLQRETRDDVPGWLSTIAYGVVIASWLAMLLFFGWCYRYAARPATTADARSRERVLA